LTKVYEMRKDEIDEYLVAQASATVQQQYTKTRGQVSRV
jgi:hypothetical protein